MKGQVSSSFFLGYTITNFVGARLDQCYVKATPQSGYLSLQRIEPLLLKWHDAASGPLRG